MKAAIHPQYFEKAQVICVCGNRFTTGSTQEIIHVELCNKCHPFYTGEQRFIDRGSKIERFNEHRKNVATYKANKKAKIEKKNEKAPMTLREMLMGLK